MMDKKNFAFKIYPLNRDLQKTWFVQVKDLNTGRIAKKYGNLSRFDTLEEKELEAAKIIAEVKQLHSIKYSPQAEGKLILKLSESLAKIEARLRPSSYHNYFSVLNRFSKWFRKESQKNKLVDPVGYLYMLQKSRYHKNYVRKQKNILQQIFKEAGNWAGFGENPFATVVTKKIKSQSLLPYSRQQVETLKEMIVPEDPQLWLAIEFLFFLFFRPNELRYLKIEHIIFDDYKIAVTADILKDNDVLQKSIPSQLRPAIEKLRIYPGSYYIFSQKGLPGKTMLSYNALRRRFLKYRRAAKLSERYGFYSWVHTGIKMAVLAGIPLKQLQLQKGHSDLQMFDEYLKNLGLEDCEQLRNNFPTL